MAILDEAGHRAFNTLFNSSRDAGKVSEIEKLCDHEIKNFLQAGGVEIQKGWEFDLNQAEITEIVSVVVKRALDNDEDRLNLFIHQYLTNKLLKISTKHSESVCDKWKHILRELINE